MFGCNKDRENSLFVISFDAGAEAGLALVTARNERDAVQILRNSGKYNSDPESYHIQQTRNIGLSTTIRTELLMESYVNALTAYEAIVSVANMLVGPPGEGEPGKSAYEIAVKNGFKGTEKEWLDSLSAGGFWEKGVGEGSLQQTGMTISDLETFDDDSLVWKFNYYNGTFRNYQFVFTIMKPEAPYDWFGFLIYLVYGFAVAKINDEYFFVSTNEGNIVWNEDGSATITCGLYDKTGIGRGAGVPSTGTIELVNGAIGDHSVAIRGGSAFGNYSLAFGGAAGRDSVAIGQASALFEDGVAIGTNAQAQEVRSVAVGAYSKATNFGEVALGNNDSHDGTGFSVGHSGSNLIEILEDGKVYFQNIGGYTGTNPESASDLATVLSGKQDTLQSGTNIKTINNQSILGSGNINIQAGDTNSVKYIQQVLTASQKEMARDNIGAASASVVAILGNIVGTV